MKAQPEDTREIPVSEDELRIATAKELFNAIRSGEMMTSLSVLEAVALDPEGALELGSDNGEDLIGVLATELEQAFTLETRVFLINALTAMPEDPRVTVALERVWFLSDDAIERMSAVSRLMREGNPRVRAHLEIALLGKDTDRAQAIANVWVPQAEDSLAVQLRLSLAAEHCEHFGLNLENLELWLSELRGAFHERARECLEVDASQTVQMLADHWKQLNRETRAWLLALASGIQSEHLPVLLECAMQDQSMQLEAIKATSAANLEHQYADQLRDFADNNPNPEIQAAAIDAGASGNNRTRALRAHARTIRIAAIRKLGANDDQTLSELIHDSDWRIRSAAADALVRLGERGKKIAQTLLLHERLEVRMAAARVLQEPTSLGI